MKDRIIESYNAGGPLPCSLEDENDEKSMKSTGGLRDLIVLASPVACFLRSLLFDPLLNSLQA